MGYILKQKEACTCAGLPLWGLPDAPPAASSALCRGGFFLAPESWAGRSTGTQQPTLGLLRGLHCLSSRLQQRPDSRGSPAQARTRIVCSIAPMDGLDRFPWSWARVILFVNNLLPRTDTIETDQKDIYLLPNVTYLFLCDYKMHCIRKLRMYKRLWNWCTITMFSNS